jgi:hypothetical protein
MPGKPMMKNTTKKMPKAKPMYNKGGMVKSKGKLKTGIKGCK